MNKTVLIENNTHLNSLNDLIIFAMGNKQIWFLSLPLANT